VLRGAAAYSDVHSIENAPSSRAGRSKRIAIVDVGCEFEFEGYALDRFVGKLDPVAKIWRVIVARKHCKTI
jgi:hypothetical protein